MVLEKSLFVLFILKMIHYMINVWGVLKIDQPVKFQEISIDNK
jgi:hypothetical protein